MKSVAGTISKEIGSDLDELCSGKGNVTSFNMSLDEFSLDGISGLYSNNQVTKTLPSVADAMTTLISVVKSKFLD